MDIKKILWMALFSTNVFLIIFSFIMTPFTGLNFNESLDPVQLVILLSGLFILMLSAVLPKKLKMIQSVQQKNESSEMAIERTKFILSLALNESATINGFILVFVFKNWTLGALLYTASLVAFLLKFPKEDSPAEKKPSGLNV